MCRAVYNKGIFFAKQTVAEWRSVFYISGGISLLGCVVFGLLATGVKQEWNDNEYKVVPSSPINSPD